MNVSEILIDPTRLFLEIDNTKEQLLKLKKEIIALKNLSELVTTNNLKATDAAVEATRQLKHNFDPYRKTESSLKDKVKLDSKIKNYRIKTDCISDTQIHTTYSSMLDYEDFNSLMANQSLTYEFVIKFTDFTVELSADDPFLLFCLPEEHKIKAFWGFLNGSYNIKDLEKLLLTIKNSRHSISDEDSKPFSHYRNFIISAILYKLHKPDDAIKLLQSAISVKVYDLSIEFIFLFLIFGKLHTTINELETAIVFLKTILKINHKYKSLKAMLLSELACAYEQAQKMEKAVDIINSTREEMDEEPLAKAILNHRQGSLYRKLKKYDLACEILSSSIEIPHDDISLKAEIKNELGLAYILAKQYKQAVKLFDDAFRSNQENGITDLKVTLNLSYAYIGLKRYKKVIKLLLPLVDVMPNLILQTKLMVHLSSAYMNLKQYREVVELIEPFLKNNDTDDFLRAALLLYLGQAYAHSKHYSEATDYIKEGIMLNSKNYLIREQLDFSLIKIYIKWGKVELAIDTIRTILLLDLNPAMKKGIIEEPQGDVLFWVDSPQLYAQIYLYLGNILFEIKDFETAFTAFNNGLALNSDDSETNAKLRLGVTNVILDSLKLFEE
ncbi:MAG: hypothetical protein K0S74_478 [Chlamydiales bacterium]|jgi:tetratricopeptide (TPR) repeat protein|nr:hypothetical protein [Chlamydiales bacterium]